MPKFAPGEIARIVPGTPTLPGLERYLGEDVEIVGPSFYLGFYRVRASDGKEFGAAEWALEKRKPPPQREELGEWALCPWRPTETERVP